MLIQKNDLMNYLKTRENFILKTEQENMLNEFLQFHGKDWFLRQLQIL